MYMYMALYRCFSTKADMLVPDPRGPLTKQVQSTRITLANEEMRPLLEARDKQAGRSAKKGLYTECAPQQKAKIGIKASIRAWRGYHPRYTRSAPRSGLEITNEYG